MFGLGVVPEVELLATGTPADAPELTAATATLRPLTSTAELASVTTMRVRTSFIAASPFRRTPRMSPEITLCHVDADNIF
jgi:hypothetical protein